MIQNRRPLRRHFSRSFRVLKEFNDHEMVIGISDGPSGLKGYIAIHNTSLGPALGGTRFQHYSNEEACLRDVLNLSKAMSYKCALAGLPLGGGKGVIMANDASNRKATLLAYAKAVENLGGLFRTGTDVGIFDSDVRLMAQKTQHMLGVSPVDRGELSTSTMAALGVFYCIKTALGFQRGSDSVKGVTVGIKGIGKLGGELARLLYEEGADVLVSDIDTTKTKKLAKQLSGISVIDSKQIHKEKLDVFSPCALGGEINGRTIKEINTSIIAGGANNQLNDDDIGDRLFEEGILYAPDYVTNAGGLIYVADELEQDGFHKKRVLERVARIQSTLRQVLEESKKRKVSTQRIANELALSRMTFAERKK